MKKPFLLITVIAAILLSSCNSTKRESNEVYEISSPPSGYSESVEISEDKEYAPQETVEHLYESADAPRADMKVAESEMAYSSAEVEMNRSEVYRDENVYIDKRVRRGEKQQVSKANLLTATEVNDFKKWDEWKELLEQDFVSYKHTWKVFPKQRFVARVSDSRQRPVVDATVKLYDAKGNLAWSARTDNTGKAELWSDAILSANNQGRRYASPYRLVFTYGNEQKVIENAQPYPQETNVVRMKTTYRTNTGVDIFFIVDATGSMGDELSYLQAELYSIIGKVKSNHSNLDIRMGSLVYRDRGDEYVTRKSSLSSDIGRTVSFLKEQSADGGGDTPEAVDEALYQAIEKEEWRSSALSRIAFLVLDAPPHYDTRSISRVQKQIVLAAAKGIRLIPLVASGMQQDGEYLMRSMALMTNGTYVTLTDDSGIGNPHAKPTTDYYRVERLNDLLIRLISDYTRIPQTLGQQ